MFARPLRRWLPGAFRDGGLVAVGAALGVRVHGGLLVQSFCPPFVTTPECQAAIGMTNQFSIGAAILGFLLLVLGFLPMVMAELEDGPEVADGAD